MPSSWARGRKAHYALRGTGNANGLLSNKSEPVRCNWATAGSNPATRYTGNRDRHAIGPTRPFRQTLTEASFRECPAAQADRGRERDPARAAAAVPVRVLQVVPAKSSVRTGFGSDFKLEATSAGAASGCRGGDSGEPVAADHV